MSGQPVPRLPEIAGYRFTEVLGEGAQGVVYLAAPPERLECDQEQVAVKVLAVGGDQTQFERAVDVLATVAAQVSPHLNRLLETGRLPDGTVYYAMEHAPAGSLASTGDQLTTSQVLEAVARAARGAHTLHEAGMSHRAIKPANVLLFADGPRLSDLDLQHVFAPGQTVSGRSSAAAAQYLAPELIRGEAESRATDVWALGVTLHVALTGRGVYDLGSHVGAIGVVRAVIGGAEPRLDPSLPAEVSDLIGECLAPHAAARPRTASAFGERLDALRARA